MTSYNIYSWNVNGIRAIEKKGLITWIEKTQPDIICFQEIKALEEQVPSSLKNINFHLDIHSAEKKGYSGVATFSKTKPTSSSQSIDVEEFDREGRVIQTRYPEFILLNVYFPNGKKDDERLNYKMRFYEHFKNYCKTLLDNNERIIVCGDVNTAHKEQDLANPKPNSKYSGFLPQERQWIDDFLAIGFTDTFREIHGDGEGDFTWWSMRSKTAKANNIGWRLDYFYISNNLLSNLKDANIHNKVEGSDHCPISISLEF